MLQIIFDFLLEPGLITTGLLALPALALLWIGSRVAKPTAVSLRRLLLSWLAANVLGLFTLIGLESAAVLRDDQLWLNLSWPLVALLWSAVGSFPLRLRWHGLWTGALTGLIGWLIHTKFTAELLFE